MITGLFAMTACGPACWEAKDDICRCSCGGKHHGIHRYKRPDCIGLKRQMVYQGFIFELTKVSEPEDMGSGVFAPSHLDDDARALNEQAGIKFYYAHTARNHYGEFPVAIVRPATESQVAKWHELAIWRGKLNAFYSKPGLLWVRRDDITREIAANLNQTYPDARYAREGAL